MTFDLVHVARFNIVSPAAMSLTATSTSANFGCQPQYVVSLSIKLGVLLHWLIPVIINLDAVRPVRKPKNDKTRFDCAKNG